MSLAEPVTHPPRWYLGFVMSMSVVAVIALGVGLIGLYNNDRNATAQAACFEAFATKFSTGSKEVRAAQVKVDEVEARADAAAADRDAAFQEVLTLIISQSEDEAEGLRVFTKLTEANAHLVEQRSALVSARMDLQRTRAEHPIPEPPEGGGCSLVDRL
jgi:hypothetical protein